MSDHEHKCKHCDKAFGEQGNLDKHVSVVHYNKKRNFKCNQCKLAFFKAINLDQHVRIYHEPL